MITAKVTRKDQLFAKLRASLPLVREAMAEANTGSADEMVALAKSFVPVEDGTLRDSIKRGVPGERGEVLVEAGGVTTTKAVRNGSTATFDYALGQEYGTAKTPARPYFWTSYRLMRKRFRARASRAIGKMIKQLASA